MASIKLTGDTSGVITVSAPASAGTNTLTLPATTGTILDTNSALASSKLTGALPAISGAALTGISSGGLTQLVSFATTSGTTITSPTLNFTGYKLIYLVANAVGLAQDTGAGYTITPNGGSAANFVGGYGPSVVMYASWWIDLSNGIGMGIMNTGGGERATAVGSGATRTFVNTGITTSTTSLAFTTAAGATFNNGSFKIYGLK